MSRGGRQTVRPSADRMSHPTKPSCGSGVARSVDKVKNKPRVTTHADGPARAGSAAHEPPPEPGEVRAAPRPPAAAPTPAPRPPAAAAGRVRPPHGAPDRLRQDRIDARLDLHGLRQREPVPSCTPFCIAARRGAARPCWSSPARVTTAGERDHLAGALGEPQRGVLRRSVPQWLGEPELRAVVLSYTSAGTRHGGEGALYVQLRKPAAVRHG